HGALEALDELTRDAGLVDARLVRVDDPDPRASQRVLVKGGFVGLEAREAADVVDEDDVGLPSARIQAELEQRQESLTPVGIQPAATADKLADDPVAMGRRPSMHLRSLFVDRQILVRTRTTVERIRRSHGVRSLATAWRCR